MKNIIFVILISFFLVKCNSRKPKLIRKGYEITTELIHCDKIIKNKMNFLDFPVKKIGEATIKKTGAYGKNLTEADALILLEKEACTINADVINIVDEKRAGLNSSSYRCTAEFYKKTDSTTIIISDMMYSNSHLKERIIKDNKRIKKMNRIAILVSLGGVLLALFIPAIVG